ncbi:MAG: Ig-like domain-containing protein [Motilibacteraceae bacterium]
MSSTARTLAGALAALLAAALLPLLAPALAHADSTTISGDLARTSWDSEEPGLAPAQVSAADFGLQHSVALDGQSYAQPLVVGNRIYATTEQATAYAVDAARGAVAWKRHFGDPFQSATVGCGDLTPDLGSTSTPVYDAASDTIYLTTKLADGATAQQPHWYLQAVSASDGTNRPGFPLLLQGVADNDPTVTFDPLVEQQRPGLLLADGVVYVAFGSQCDYGDFRGWVLAAKVTGTPSMMSAWTSQVATGEGGGIWQSGGGLMSDGDDANGNPRIFLATGNGISPPAGPGSKPPGTLGDSVVRIGLDATGHLTTRDFFAPSDAVQLDKADTDLGAGGPVALPAVFGTASHPHVVVQDGKDGRLFLLDRDHLGGMAQGPSGGDDVIATIGPHQGIWGHPAVYGGEGGWVYYVENSGPLRAYRKGTTAAGDPTLVSAGGTTQNFPFSSGSPLVTSDGTTAGSALVWVVYAPDGTGKDSELRAYDAVPSNGHLTLRWSAPIGTSAKFSMPAAGSGGVSVGTRDGHLLIFGRPSTAPLSASTVDFGDVAVGSTGTATATFTASRAVTVSAANAPAPFAVSSSLSLPRTLAAGDTLAVPVTVKPTAPGAVSGTLTLTTDAGTGSTVTTDLHAQATQPGLAASPASADFGTVPTGTSSTLSVSIVNTGTTDETVTAVSAPGAPFTASLPEAGTVIPAQGSVAVPVTYAPTAAVTSSSSLSVTSADGTAKVPLTGTGQTGQGVLTLKPSTTDFGAVAVGTSKTLTFDVTNTGNVPIKITLAKAPSGVFSSANPLAEGLTLQPGAVVHQQVTFTPTTTGNVSATYAVDADTGQGTQYEQLTGTGTTASTLPAPTGAGWTRNGSTTVSGSDLVLTDTTRTTEAGSAFSGTAVPSDGLDATFTVQIGGGTGADGMTFTLLDGSAPATSLGAAGGALGYGGLAKAVAVTMDTWKNGSDPSGNFVGVADGTLTTKDDLHYLSTSTAIGDLRSGAHTVHVTVSGGRMQVAVDGTTRIDVPVTLPTTVRPGFTAGTGGSIDNHVVRDVTITTPSTGGTGGTIDTTGPTVSLTAPTTGATVSGTTTVTASAADAGSGVASVQLLLDGDALGKPLTAAPYTASWDTAQVADGAHRLAAKATDAAGNTTTSSAVTVTVSNPTTTPTTTLPAPTGTGWTRNGSAAVSSTDLVLTTTAASRAGSAFSNTAVPSDGLDATFTAQIGGGTGADGMTFTLLDGAAPATSLGGAGGALGYGGLAKAVAVTLDTWKNGSDPSGNFVGVADGTTTSPDTMHYLATSTAIGDLRTGTHTVHVTVSGGRMQVAVDGTQRIDVAVTLPTSVRPGFTGATGGSTDNHVVRDVTITAGSSGSTGSTGGTADTTAPAVGVTAPASGATVAGTTTVTAGATDAGSGVASVLLLLDGKALGAAVSAAPYSLSWDTTTATDGEHVLSATATDKAGNTATSTGVTVTVDNTSGTTTTLPVPSGTGWTRNGSTTVDAGDLVLTKAGATGKAGSAFSGTALAADGLDATFTAQIGGGTGADGLTFTLLDPTAPATSLGNAGGGLGYGGLSGVAVTLDTWKNGDDPSGNFVGVADGTLSSKDNLHYLATSSAVGELRTGTHAVRVHVSGGRLTVTVDGVQRIDVAVTLPATVRPGFTGANGGSTDDHVVRGVTITGAAA